MFCQVQVLPAQQLFEPHVPPSGCTQPNCGGLPPQMPPPTEAGQLWPEPTQTLLMQQPLVPFDWLKQLLYGQHVWPGPPQLWQLPLTHIRFPPVHVLPQQGAPTAVPHWIWQVPAAQMMF
jgi:hypothetical protein